jgi:acylphosphatase
MKSCKRCIISGNVQGVFYRHSTVKQAAALGLKGWVRNLENGDVECLVCGDEQAIEKLCAWLWQGPPSATVTNVLIKEFPWEEHSAFEIQR